MSSSPKRPAWSATAIRTPNGDSAPPTTTQAPLRRPSERPISGEKRVSASQSSTTTGRRRRSV